MVENFRVLSRWNCRVTFNPLRPTHHLSLMVMLKVLPIRVDQCSAVTSGETPIPGDQCNAVMLAVTSALADQSGIRERGIMKAQAFPGLLQQDLDQNMRIYKITKHFRGGRGIYYALRPKTEGMDEDVGPTQLDSWGENTNGGHESGWEINAEIVNEIPENATRLYFDKESVA